MALFELFLAVVISAVTSGGFATWLVKRWIEKKLTAAESAKNADLERRREDHVLADKERSQISWLLRWLVKGAQNLEAETSKKYWNGETSKAWDEYCTVEKERREHRRKWQAYYNEK